MQPATQFVDIHCHMLPGIDDGAQDWDQSLAMARMAAADGIGAVIVTPHQLGNFGHNTGAMIRALVSEYQMKLDQQGIPLRVRAGADVRIEDGMVGMLRRGEVLTLGDHGKHVLLELPHELYFPLEPVLDELAAAGMQGILSHPERNHGLLQQSRYIPELVEYGCLMQVTSSSLLGAFGAASRELGEWMVREGLVHFISTDAHGVKSRRPHMSKAMQRVSELADDGMARRLCYEHPLAVFEGRDVSTTTPAVKRPRWGNWLRRKRVA